MTTSDFKSLFQPGCIGKLRLKNRVIMLPMGTQLAGLMGEVTDDLVAHYARRAQGGAGLITIEATQFNTTIDPMRIGSQPPRIDEDVFILGFTRLTEAVHEAGACISLQLSAGPGGGLVPLPWLSPVGGGRDAKSPTVSGPVRADVSDIRVLATEEIGRLVETCGKAAGRAARAGFDAVELHSHGRYLMAQFLSAAFNKRTDRYGGSTEKRLTFLLECITAVRANTSPDFPLVVRFCVDEGFPGGRGAEESQGIARRLEEAGVSAISADAGDILIPPMYTPREFGVQWARAIKDVVKIPVIAAYRLGDPEFAEKVLKEGHADFIGLGRALLADPDFVVKTRRGELKDIRRCLSCNECESMTTTPYGGLRYRAIRCTVNPAAGRDRTYGALSPVTKRKKVVVVGGGPAGMEAARVAALRGHEVVLFEANTALGGQLRLASKPPAKEVLDTIVDYYSAQFSKMPGVDVRLGCSATAGLLREMGPDFTIIATGAKPCVPDIPGIHGDNMVTAFDVLGGNREIGKTVVIAGGGMIGCETAHYLADRGCKVTVVEMLGRLAADVGDTVRRVLLRKLEDAGVAMLPGMRVTAFGPTGVTVQDRNGNSRQIDGDTIVLALGAKAEDTLLSQIQGARSELYIIGDAREPRRIRNAISEGFAIANRI